MEASEGIGVRKGIWLKGATDRDQNKIQTVWLLLDRRNKVLGR